MNSKTDLKAWVDPKLPEVLKERIPALELLSEDDPESLMLRAQKRAGALELIAIMEGMVRAQDKRGAQ